MEDDDIDFLNGLPTIKKYDGWLLSSIFICKVGFSPQFWHGGLIHESGGFSIDIGHIKLDFKHKLKEYKKSLIIKAKNKLDLIQQIPNLD